MYQGRVPSSKHWYVSPDLIHCLYCGVYQSERLIIAGGAHALTPPIAWPSPGRPRNILALPEARGRGYATASITSLVATLFNQHIADVVLNVFEDNVQTICVYRRVVFQAHHRLMTGKARCSHEYHEGAPHELWKNQRGAGSKRGLTQHCFVLYYFSVTKVFWRE